MSAQGVKAQFEAQAQPAHVLLVPHVFKAQKAQPPIGGVPVVLHAVCLCLPWALIICSPRGSRSHACVHAVAWCSVGEGGGVRMLVYAGPRGGPR